MVIYQRVNFSVLTYLTRSDQERRSSEKKKARKALNMSDVPAVILGSESHFGNRGVGLWVVQGQVGETTDFCTDNSIICWCKYVLCDRMCVQIMYILHLDIFPVMPPLLEIFGTYM